MEFYDFISKILNEQKTPFLNADFGAKSGQALVADSVSIITADLGVLQRETRVLDGDAASQSADIEQGEEGKTRLYHGGVGDNGDLRMRIDRQRVYSERIQPEQDRQVCQRMIEPTAQHAQQQKIIKAPAQRLTRGKDGIGIVLGTGENDGLR